MSEPEIKPCPFCGTTPDVSDERCFDTNSGTKWGVLRCGCGASGPEVRTGYKPVIAWKAEAIEMWNDRTVKA